jgi:hypothetical protein
MIKLDTKEQRKIFIQNTESNIYSGKNINNEEIIIYLEKGKGMDIKTKRHEKKKWYEVIEYNNNGHQISLSYEPV